MTRRFKYRRDDGGSMLASVIVLICGCGIGFVLALTVESLKIQLALMAIGGLTVYQVIRLRYGHGNSGKLGIWYAMQRNPYDDNIAAQYRPVRVKKRNVQQTSSNQPITAEEAHDLQASSSNTWVPGRATAESKRDTSGS